MKWVREKNGVAINTIGDPEVRVSSCGIRGPQTIVPTHDWQGSESYRRILSILDSKDKIPHVTRIGKDSEVFTLNESPKVY